MANRSTTRPSEVYAQKGRALRRSIGLLRSIFMYHGIPLRNRALARFHAQFVRPGDLCFDIGAHVGNRLWAFLKLGALVVALEPQPDCMRYLRRRYGRHANVELVEQAVGATPGTRTLFISERTPTVSTISGEWISTVKATPGFAGVRWDRAIPVRVATLDELIARYGTPVFCKIDVEGSEFDVLRGLSYPLEALSFEYVPAAVDVAVACIGRLGELGRYEYNWSPSELHRLRSSVWLGPGQMSDLLRRMPVGGWPGDVYARRLD